MAYLYAHPVNSLKVVTGGYAGFYFHKCNVIFGKRDIFFCNYSNVKQPLFVRRSH